jgi:hypothetical protein
LELDSGAGDWSWTVVLVIGVSVVPVSGVSVVPVIGVTVVPVIGVTVVPVIGVTVVPVLKLGSRWKCLVSCIPWLMHPPGKEPLECLGWEVDWT